MSIRREERKGMKKHSAGMIYVSRTTPVGSPETLFRQIFRKNPTLPNVAQDVCKYVRRHGSIEARRYWYKRLAAEFRCSETNLKTVLYKLVAIGLLNREAGKYTFSTVFERRLQEMLTVIRDIKSAPPT